MKDSRKNCFEKVKKPTQIPCFQTICYMCFEYLQSLEGLLSETIFSFWTIVGKKTPFAKCLSLKQFVETHSWLLVNQEVDGHLDSYAHV
jgi:hypothetical protein